MFSDVTYKVRNAQFAMCTTFIQNICTAQYAMYQKFNLIYTAKCKNVLFWIIFIFCKGDFTPLIFELK